MMTKREWSVDSGASVGDLLAEVESAAYQYRRDFNQIVGSQTDWLTVSVDGTRVVLSYDVEVSDDDS